MATSQELIRAPGIRNQPERPRGREAKQADLGTIYRGRPPTSPASSRQHESNKRSMLLSSNSRAPLNLWRSSLITHGFEIPIRHGFSHSTPAGGADVTSSDSIRAAMTSSQPQLEIWHPSTTRGCSNGQCESRRRLLQRVALTHRQDASVNTQHPTGSTMMRHTKRVRTEIPRRMTHQELWHSLDKVPVS